MIGVFLANTDLDWFIRNIEMPPLFCKAGESKRGVIDGIDPIKYYSTSAAAEDCGVTKQTLDYAYRNRCTRIVRRKGGVKEFRIKCLD